MSELDQLRRSHHCIGTGRAVADLIFKIAHGRAMENGGTISAEDILSLKAQFILNLPSGMDFFERINRECMQASGGAAPDPFSRKNILSTLLLACGKGSAEYAFKLQIEKCSSDWLGYFFQGLSEVARNNLSQDSWQELIAAYVHTAEISKSKMQVLDLMARNDVKKVLSDSVAPLYKISDSNEIGRSTSAAINNVISRKYNITGSSIAKITNDQMERFLGMLSKEMPLRLHLPATAEDQWSIAVR